MGGIAHIFLPFSLRANQISLKVWLARQFYGDKSRWPLWSPVFLSFGIALYFRLPFEPSPFLAYGGIFLGTGVFWKKQPLFSRLLCLVLGIVSLGFTASFFRTHALNTVMLHAPLPPIYLEGTVTNVELKPTLKGTFYQRLILALPSPSLPQKVRLTVKGKHPHLWPGDLIRINAKLSPIPDGALPGAFDFRRHAYFQGIGGTGFALSPPAIRGAVSSWKFSLEKKRAQITVFLLEKLPSPQGSIAAALITGDKSAIPEEIREKFIDSGLAHILAISGLHLTIIAGVVFAILRRGLSLIPSLSLVYNTKKIAALGTIFVTFCYLVLSGFGIPAQRAFMMITLVMGAILMDRMALSMRSVALAAFLILLSAPESLLSPSFQLSFAAVVGLIAGYERWQNPLTKWMTRGGIVRKVMLYIGGTALTSCLATLATLPITLYSFHHFSLHAVEANLLAIPLISLVIMPLAFLSCLLIPLGGGMIFLGILGKAIALLVYSATLISSWPGAHISVAQPPFSAFCIIILGGLWVALWQQSWRWLGLIPIFWGGALAFLKDPPHILVDGRGKVAALYDSSTLYLNSKRRGKFTVESWAAALGATKKEILICEGESCQGKVQGIPVYISTLKEAQPCVSNAILIRLEPSQRSCPQALYVLDWYDLWKGGSHALWITDKGIRVEKVRSTQQRPWSKKAIPRSRISPNYGADPHPSLSAKPYNRPTIAEEAYK